MCGLGCGYSDVSGPPRQSLLKVESRRLLRLQRLPRESTHTLQTTGSQSTLSHAQIANNDTHPSEAASPRSSSEQGVINGIFSKIGNYFNKSEERTPSPFKGTEISFNQEDSRILNPGNQLTGGEVMRKQGSLANELTSGETAAQRPVNLNPNYKSTTMFSPPMSTLSDIFVTKHASQPQPPFSSQSYQTMYANFKTIIITQHKTKVSKAITFKGCRIFDRDQYGGPESSMRSNAGAPGTTHSGAGSNRDGQATSQNYTTARFEQQPPVAFNGVSYGVLDLSGTAGTGTAQSPNTHSQLSQVDTISVAGSHQNFPQR